GCQRCLKTGGIYVAQNGVCFLQQAAAHESHRKLRTYCADVSFYPAASHPYYGGIMTFAWATDIAVLRHLSTAIIQARFQQAGLQ
ncbi:polyamine aminopropyltransferase, partial [Enterobacter hormaechei]